MLKKSFYNGKRRWEKENEKIMALIYIPSDKYIGFDCGSITGLMIK